MGLFPSDVYHRVPGYPTDYPIGYPVTNYPDTAALVATESQTQMNVNVCERFARGRYVKVVT